MMTHPESSPLIARLKRALLRQRLVLAAAGVLTVGSLLLAVWIGLSLLAAVVIVPVWLKLILMMVAATALIWLAVDRVLVRAFQGSVKAMAVRLEQRYPELKGRLVAAVEFARMKTTPGYSQELIDLVQKQALQQAEQVDFKQAVSTDPVTATGRTFGIAAGVALVLLLLAPGMFRHSFEVYSHPTTEIAPPLGYRLVAFPGSVEWVKYRDIEIGAVVLGDQFPDKAVVHHRLAGGNWQQNEIDLRTTGRTATAQGDSLRASVRLRQINKSFDYFVEAGKVRTEVQQVDVVDRPRVNGIKVSIFYPKYSGLPPQVIDENNGSFSALVGSRVNLDIETNLPVEHAALVFADSSRTAMKPGDRQASASLYVDTSRSYHVELVDHLGEMNPDPIQYYITAVPDEYPSIDVISPGFDVNLGDDMALPMKVRIFDDFGFSSLVLKYRLMTQGRESEEHVAVLHFAEKIKTEGDVEFTWDLDQFNLFPGDFVLYRFEVSDNDAVSGPKTTASRQYAARLPSLDEIVAQAEAESSQRIDKTRQLLQTGRDLSERMAQAARKLRAEQKETSQTDWQHQKELSSIAEKNSELLDDIEKTAQQMNEQIDRLAEQALVGREILEKLAQIQKLFQEVATPEMKEAQRQLMEALKNMDPSELSKAAEDFQMSMEELLERLERTLALLKKLQMEQKMEAMLRQAEELVERQEAVNKETDSTSSDNLPRLSPNEDEIKDGLQSLKDQVRELQDMAQQAEMSQNPQVQKFNEAVQKTDADQNMAQMSQALQKQKRDAAQEQGQQSLSKLQQMLNQMQQEFASLKGDDQEAIKKAMRMAMDDANLLSRSQEDLLREAANLSPQSVMMRDMALSQQDMMSSCAGLQKRLSELGKASPFVAAELQSLVGGAMQQMEMAMQSFSDKRCSQAQNSQREAMSRLNRAAIRLMESLEQQSQCDKGGSCDKNMSMLQSLCNKQNQLNQQCQRQSGECSKPGGQNPQPGRESLQRMAGEQGAIRKSMEQLAQEFGGSRQILGRLDDIARDMREIEDALAAGEVGPEVTERQLRVYSRMLEASRSLQRRDFTEQRRAATARDVMFVNPPQLPPELLDAGTDLEDRLRRYMSGEFPPQYEEQIKAYFKALLQIEAEMYRSPSPEPSVQP